MAHAVAASTTVAIPPPPSTSGFGGGATVTFQACEGPASSDSLIAWDIPQAPEDAKKTNKLRQKLDLPPIKMQSAAANTPAQDVINRFILPREWVDPEDGTRWVQKASAAPASRLEVVLLQEKLDRLLAESGAKQTGICPHRRRYYSECFDEVIRQVTAECVERGLLLLRIRDERNATLDAYTKLFESRMSYGFRLALKGEQEVLEGMQRLEQVKQYKAELDKQAEDWKSKIDATLKTQEERFKEDEKKYADEINALKKENLAKKTQLESCCIVQKR